MSFLDKLVKDSEPIVAQIIEVIKNEHPIIVAKIAESVFANEGAFNGRPRWKANASSTIKRKGGDSPNVESGELENWLTTPDNAADEDYMFKLPRAKRSKSSGNGYWFANEIRPFNDIGKTEQDHKLIDSELEKKIGEHFAGT